MNDAEESPSTPLPPSALPSAAPLQSSRRSWWLGRPAPYFFCGLLLPLLLLLLPTRGQGQPLASNGSHEGGVRLEAFSLHTRPARRWSRVEVLQQVMALLEEAEEEEMERGTGRRSVLGLSMTAAGGDLKEGPHAPPSLLQHPERRSMAEVNDVAPAANDAVTTSLAPLGAALPMEGVFLRIGVVIEPPLVTRKGNQNATRLADAGLKKISQSVYPNAAYGGLLIDVLRSHSTNLGFTYQIMEPTDGFFGTLQADGSYNGLMGQYQREEVDVLYSGLHMNSERAKLIDFTQSVLPSGYKILTKPIKRETNIWFVLSPFHYTLWLAILGMVLVMAAIFKVIDTASPYGKRVHSSPTWLYHACGILLNVDSFQSINHHGFAASILTMVWTFSTLAILTLYTANMVSNLTVQRLEAPVHSISDIMRHQVKVATIASSASRTWTLDHYPGLESLEVQYKTFADAVHGLRKGQVEAVVFVTAVVEAVAKRPPCDLMTTGESFGNTFIGVGMRPGSPYYKDINELVYSQITAGDIEKFTAAYLSDECAAGDPDAAGTETIKLQDVRGLFFILGIGILFAFLCLLIQVVRYRYVIRRFGSVLYQNDLDENSFMRLFLDDSAPRSDDALLLIRRVKLALLKLGMNRHDIQVIMSSVDANTDGFLDPYELEHLKMLAKRALAAHKGKVSPYSVNAKLWRINSRALSFSDRATSGSFWPSSARQSRDAENDLQRTESKKDYHSLYVVAAKE